MSARRNGARRLTGRPRPPHPRCPPLRRPSPHCSEFQTALGYKGKESSIFVDRIFNLFDENGDGAM